MLKRGESETQRIALGLRQRDVDVLEALVQQYQYRLVRYLIYLLGQRDGVDDLVQETWLRVLERGGSYDGHSRFEPWLFRLARNIALDAMRTRQTLSLDADDDDRGIRPVPASSQPSPFTLAARTEDSDRLARSLKTPEPMHREVLVLRFQEDLPLQEISDIVGAPVSTVASRIYRGLAALRPCSGKVQGRDGMKMDDHESFQHMIDESLAGGISAEREQSLREHLGACAPCQEYLSASKGVMSGLSGFSFEVDPKLDARVVASLRLRAQQVHAAQTRRQRWLLVSLAAVVLTMGSSFLDLQFDLRFGGLIACVFDIQREQLQQGLLTFWIVPSLCVFLLFPLLPLLSKAGTSREERIP